MAPAALVSRDGPPVHRTPARRALAAARPQCETQLDGYDHRDGESARARGALPYACGVVCPAQPTVSPPENAGVLAQLAAVRGAGGCHDLQRDRQRYLHDRLPVVGAGGHWIGERGRALAITAAPLLVSFLSPG